MKISNRLEQAITKLYEAFHSNTLQPECCKQCAVGNILNNSDAWKHLSDEHGSVRLNYVGLVNQKFGKRFAGYTPLELLNIEKVFLEACGYAVPLSNNGTSKPKITKDILFKALDATVAYLCKLDGNHNVMDCRTIFNYEPKEHLILA